MPRSVFRLVWTHLKASRPVAALIKNLAKDGRYYWVVAVIVPTPEGYLSVRFKPTGRYCADVAELYARILAEERRVREGGAGEDAAMDAGTAALAAALRKLGHDDYDEFMRVMLCEELKSRDAALTRAGKAIIQPLPRSEQVEGEKAVLLNRLVALYAQGEQAYDHLNRLFQRLDEFVALHHALEQKSTFVNNLTGELRLAAMNVALASSRLGSEGQGLGVISHYMGGTSGEIAGAVRQLVGGITTVSDRLRAVIFNLAASRLQIEMLLFFVRELHLSLTRDIRHDRRQVSVLHAAFSRTLGEAGQALRELEGSTRGLNATSHSLGRQMIGLQVAQLGGRVESARLVQLEGFAAVFGEIRRQIDSTHDQLNELSEALGRLEKLAIETPVIAQVIEEAADRMEEEIGAVVTA